MKRFITVVSSLFLTVAAGWAANHPVLLLTKEGVASIREGKGKAPLFDSSLSSLLEAADAALVRPLDVPLPRDGGGGYTHEAHKQNYYDMYNCGIAYQMTGDARYAEKVKAMLSKYSDMYPGLGYHPVELSPVRGKLFWQTLNESVWLVHTSIAYDCVYDYLTPSDRKKFEKKLFRPAASFIMEGTPDNRANRETFNKMHNHGTWALCAVGMIGMAMGDEDLVHKSLYGSEEGGGFLRQLETLFSPDGYFTEGAYYQRYALWPFVLYAQCLSHYMPSLDIFAYRDGIISKAVDALLQLAYCGEFFHYNDALEKGYSAQELIYAVDIIYNSDQRAKSLLGIARDYQGKVLVSDAGYAVARDIAAGEAEDYNYRSSLFRDGGDGTQGALAVLRARAGNTALTFKATSHGLSHGHYDKLTYAFYDDGHEVVSDYGAARFLNIEAKYKGHYTRENKSYAMTTVAHNTLVVDGKSHFGGKIKVSSKYSPTLTGFDAASAELQYVSARDTAANPGVVMQRWIALAELPFLDGPLVVDILSAESDRPHRYDLPLHYNGHMISLSVPYERALSSMSPLGEKNGYQHLWVEASANGGEGFTTYSWLCGKRVYSYSSATTPATQVRLLRIGANDPDFNLRPEPAVLLRENSVSSHVFASCIETHGRYDLQTEQAADMVHSCRGVEVISDDSEGIKVKYRFSRDTGEYEILVFASRKDGSLRMETNKIQQ